MYKFEPKSEDDTFKIKGLKGREVLPRGWFIANIGATRNKSFTDVVNNQPVLFDGRYVVVNQNKLLCSKLNIEIISPFVEEWVVSDGQTFAVVLNTTPTRAKLFNLDAGEVVSVKNSFEENYLPISTKASLLSRKVKIISETEQKVVSLYNILRR